MSAPEFIEVAYVEHDEIHVLTVTPDCLAACRERGWMVFDDFEKDMATVFNPPRIQDSYSGDDAAQGESE